MNTLTHKSAFHSLRGIRSEGTYVYGTIAAVDRHYNDHVAGSGGGSWWWVCRHRSLDNAARRCNESVKRDIKHGKAVNEAHYISAVHVRDTEQ